MGYFRSLKPYDETRQLIYGHLHQNDLEADKGYLIIDLKEDILIKAVEPSIEGFCEYCSRENPVEIFFEEINESVWKVKAENMRGFPERFAGDIGLLKFKLGY
jgi:hypothetical protein